MSSNDANEKVDQSKYAEEKIAEVKAALAAGAALDDPSVTEALFNTEKKCRLSNDAVSTKLVVLAMMGICKEKKEWARLNGLITLLSKRRSQSKMCITGMVATAIEYLEAEGVLPGKPEREALLTCLKDVTDGKIYVEAEKAKVTRWLSQMKEAEGKVDEAAEILQEVYVETYGALSKQEKIDYILEQIRLTLAKHDNVRAYILSKKIQRKFLLEDDFQDLKLRFYRLMIEYHTREKDSLELAQHSHSILTTKCVLDDEAQWTTALQQTLLFLVLAPHTNHQSDMLHRLNVEHGDKLEKLPAYLSAWKSFTTDEIIAYPLEHQQELEAHVCLHTASDEVFKQWQKDFHTRIVQHNIRVVNKYYKQIELNRLAELLGLSQDDTERSISTLVSDGTMYAKIDRPAGIVSFDKPKPPEETLSDWAANISTCLGLVETTCHLINKETMIHKIDPSARAA